MTLEQSKALEILRNNCKSCHVDQALGGVTNILSVDHLVREGLIQVGKPDESKLFIAVNSNKMPPSGPLTATEKNDLRVWILQLGNQSGGSVPVDLGFDIKMPVEPLSLRTRLGKLSYLVQSTTDPSLDKVKADRMFLGDYDFSKAILPKVSWEATDMKAWLEAVEPVCVAQRSRFPWPSGAASFVLDSLGRSPSSLENTLIQEISAMGVSTAEKFDIFCMSILTSKEYTAK